MPPPPPPPPRAQRATAASKEENAYIPQFISKKPFYVGEDDPTSTSTDYLEHQRLQKKEEKNSGWYDRGKKAGPAATKWRKGACENCGAMGHKRRDCLEKPRKVGAKWSGRDIQADDLVQEVNLGWEAKHDRWNGFDARDYREVVEGYNQMEEIRRHARAKKAAEEGRGDEEKEGDGDHYADEVDMGKHQPTSTRQLRLREDTAKYLLNLDLESAKYDPKTRAIVDAGATNDKAAELFAQQGFLKATGEAAEFEKAQKYAWETQEKTGDTSQHLQANPTAGQIRYKKEREEAEKARQHLEKVIEELYGSGATSTAMPNAPRDMAVTESERFVEYDDVGLIKGAPKTVAKSKYPEDVYPTNHTSVFGSWWADFKWGYACCHSFVKNSYCMGEEGKKIWAEERTGANFKYQEEPGEKVTIEEKAVEEDVARPQKAAKKRTVQQMMAGVTEAELEEYRRKRMASQSSESTPISLCHAGLRLSRLSLTRIGCVERLLWVQMLDLSHNKLRSITGLEALQLLVCLNLSNNQISSFTALEPLKLLKSLKILNISYNEIGSHPVDTSRYLCASPLSHANEVKHIIEEFKKDNIKVGDNWEAILLFKELNLTQLDITGNAVVDETFRDLLLKLLPALKWLDGIRV